MVESATEMTTTEHDEIQKPIMFDYQKKINESSCGDMGIPELTENDSTVIRGK